MTEQPLIGFIGQGWIGKNYADNFAERAYQVVRYSLAEEHQSNRQLITNCDIVFIAVPTPSTPTGFDDSAIDQALSLVGQGKIAVIKSTVLPGTTEKFQQKYPEIVVMHSPEFLTEATARADADKPNRNIIGVTVLDDFHRLQAERVLAVLPPAPYQLICQAKEAELIKYGGNCWFYFKVVFINLLYDLSQKLNCDYNVIKQALSADPRIGETHLDPIHKSGRGAGGHCFIKDFAAFSRLYDELIGDKAGRELLRTMAEKNIALLKASHKDLDLLAGVYGQEAVDNE